jgi:4-amino-4-deoxychorismate lyase
MYFETIRYENGIFHNLSFHEKRILDTINANIHLSDYLVQHSLSLLRCKVIYDKYKLLNVSYNLYIKKKINSLKLIYDNNISYNSKMTNREEINSLYDKRDNADDIIIVKNGFITDTSIANIAILDKNNNWITPKIPLLKGTTRQRLIDNKIIFEQNITVEDLISSKQIALMNAMIGFEKINTQLSII